MKQDRGEGGLSGSSGTPGKGGYKAPEVVDKPLVPRFSWKELMAQFVTSQKAPESTYAKISKRSITGVATAVQTGAGVVKPGERQNEEAFKLLFVFDTSGTMYHAMPAALAEAENLITKNYDNVSGALGVTFFSDGADYYAANLADKKFWPVPSFTELDKRPLNTLPLAGLFRLRGGGGTDFNEALSSELAKMASKGYNIIMFTDADIMHGNNWKVFVNFYKSYKRHMFLILSDNREYTAVCKKLGSQPGTFGHL